MSQASLTALAVCCGGLRCGMDAESLSRLVKLLASSYGFAACGICSAEPIDRADFLQRWLQAGFAGEMSYLAKTASLRLDPRGLLPAARSVIVVAWLYRVREEPEGVPAGLRSAEAPAKQAFPDGRQAFPVGRIARYAWGRDYHRVIRRRLQKLVIDMQGLVGRSFRARICVDTAPVLEKELAVRAGIGWMGKNCLVLNRYLGSYFCLGVVLTDLEMAYDQPQPQRCGNCTRCIEACPTGALIEPYKLDASRCISYLTIEQRRQIPGALSPLLAGWIFGCDVCQEVCPYNLKTPALSIDADAAARWPAGRIAPDEVLRWSRSDWDAITRGRALRRASYEMWLRNAKALLGSRSA